MMSQWSACRLMKIYHMGMCSIWIKWLCISRRLNFFIYLLYYLNRIIQSTKLTVHVRYTNKVMSPPIPKIENWNESIMLIFFQCFWPTTFLLLYPFLGWFFLYGAYFLLSFFTSPPEPLGVMLNTQSYVETHASVCSPWGLVYLCTDMHHFGGTTQ